MRGYIATAAMLFVTQADAAPAISVAGSYNVGVAPTTFSDSANPLAVEGVVPDFPGAISVGHIDASAGVAGGILSFEHDQWGFGTGNGSAMTAITQTFVNTVPGNVRLRFDTTILAGLIGLSAAVRAGDDLLSTTTFPVGDLDLVARLVFDITVDGRSLYNATASLISGSGGVVEVLGGGFSALNGLTRTAVPGSNRYVWDNTALSFDLGILDTGESRTVRYGLMTETATDSICFWQVNGCGLAQVSFGDPRGGGGGGIEPFGVGTGEFSFTATPIDDGIVPFADVPTPATFGLLGLGAATLLLRRRRALP